MNSIVKAALISAVLVCVMVVAAFFLLRDRKPRLPTDDGGPPAVADEDHAGKAVTGQKSGSPINPDMKTEEVPFSVRVLDAATKVLLPKASIRISKVNEGDRPGEIVYESGRSSGANGEFNITIAPGMYQVLAQCPTYGSLAKKATILKERNEVLSLELGRGVSISGRILDKQGRGIGGAAVRAYHQIGDPHASMIDRLIGIIDLQKWAAEPPAETVSASDGSYQIDGLERKYYTVKANAAKFSPNEVANILPSKDGVNIVLAPGGEVAGFVVEATTGSGIEGAKVMAYNHVDSNDIFAIIETRSRPPMETATTGVGGAFQLESLGAGAYNFVAAASGFQDGKFLKIRIREGENPPQRFSLARGLRIAGTVLSPSNEPVAGAKVRATKVGDASRNEQIFIKFDDGSIGTDGDGRFAFDTLEPGKYTLLAWHRDYATEQRRDVDAGSDDITITLPLGGAVSGMVTEAGTGKAIAGARISVSDMQDLRKDGVTDEKGAFYVGGLNSSGGGKRYLNIQADGYSRISNFQVLVEEGKTTESQNFELQPTATVSGRVVNNAKGGVSNARVIAQRRGASAAVPLTVGSAVTDSDGRYRIRDLEAGDETTLKVMTGAYLETTSDPFNVRPGDAVELPDLVLRLGGTVQGVVVDANGRPVAEVQVSVREEGKTAADVALTGSTDSLGRFTINGLQSGVVELVAKHNHYIEEVVTGVKVAEGLVTRNVKFVLAAPGSPREEGER